MTSLSALHDVCPELGLEFLVGKRKHKWYGTSVGDAPLPEGYEAKDLGKCDHVIRVKDNLQAYEVGVVEKADGTVDLLYDEWQGGFGLMDKIGAKAHKLIQTYVKHEAVAKLKKKGFRLTSSEVLGDGQLLKLNGF